jgi:hypothetical protein
VTVVKTGRPEDFSASLQWLAAPTSLKTLPQLLIASAYWSAWFWDMFERSAVGDSHRHLDDGPASPSTESFSYVRSTPFPARGSALSKFGYWCMLFLWYAIRLGWVPRLRGGVGTNGRHGSP